MTEESPSAHRGLGPGTPPTFSSHGFGDGRWCQHFPVDGINVWFAESGNN